jgi:glycosyltransferase involved in cell wall biosynthesis
VFVCPLRTGAGVKNKLLAAMAMRCPVVATSLSLEGLEACPGEQVLVADTPFDFATQVLRLLTEPWLAKRLADQSCAVVRDRYSWTARGEMFERSLYELLDAAHSASPRLTA